VNLVEPLESGVGLPTEIDGVPVRVEITGRVTRRKPG
jgi:hypothetical protein